MQQARKTKNSFLKEQQCSPMVFQGLILASSSSSSSNAWCRLAQVSSIHSQSRSLPQGSSARRLDLSRIQRWLLRTSKANIIRCYIRRKNLQSTGTVVQSMISGRRGREHRVTRPSELLAHASRARTTKALGRTRDLARVSRSPLSRLC